MPIPALPEYRDPLHLLIECIAEAAPPDCDMVLVHDDDLAQLDGVCDSIPLDSLQSSVTLRHMRSLRPTAHITRIDLSSGMETETSCVATLSSIFQERAPASTSSIPQSFPAVTPRTRLSASSKLWSFLCCSIFFFFRFLHFSSFFASRIVDVDVSLFFPFMTHVCIFTQARWQKRMRRFIRARQHELVRDMRRVIHAVVARAAATKRPL